MQVQLFGSDAEPAVVGFRAARRTDLGQGAWIEHVPGFVAGQLSVFDLVLAGTAWAHQRRPMYDRIVDVPRLLGKPPALPVVQTCVERFHERYRWTLDRVSAAFYRDGRDSVAWHGDKMGELRSDCVIAILCLGSERRFLLRPAGGGPSRTIRFVGGDLLVMGGTAQETWEHCVPKCRDAGPRIALVFRPGVARGVVAENRAID